MRRRTNRPGHIPGAVRLVLASPPGQRCPEGAERGLHRERGFPRRRRCRLLGMTPIPVIARPRQRLRQSVPIAFSLRRIAPSPLPAADAGEAQFPQLCIIARGDPPLQRWARVPCFSGRKRSRPGNGKCGKACKRWRGAAATDEVSVGAADGEKGTPHQSARFSLTASPQGEAIAVTPVIPRPVRTLAVGIRFPRAKQNPPRSRSETGADPFFRQPVRALTPGRSAVPPRARPGRSGWRTAPPARPAARWR